MISLKTYLKKIYLFTCFCEHLEYIEEKVNFILDGLFPYSISIKVEEDEIVISVLDIEPIGLQMMLETVVLEKRL